MIYTQADQRGVVYLVQTSSNDDGSTDASIIILTDTLVSTKEKLREYNLKPHTYNKVVSDKILDYINVALSSFNTTDDNISDIVSEAASHLKYAEYHNWYKPTPNHSIKTLLAVFVELIEYVMDVDSNSSYIFSGLKPKYLNVYKKAFNKYDIHFHKLEHYSKEQDWYSFNI